MKKLSKLEKIVEFFLMSNEALKKTSQRVDKRSFSSLKTPFQCSRTLVRSALVLPFA